MKFTGKALVAGVALFGAARLNAQTVEFAGTTSGCFYTADICTPTAPASLLTLQFNSGSFDVNTVNGYVGIGGTAQNLGTMTLASGADNFTALGEQFLLDVTFSVPYIAGSNAYYVAALLGAVTSNGHGGVQISFSAPQTFFFDGPTYAGSFTLAVNSFAITPNAGPQAISGSIRTTVTPEPPTIGLLALGLLGIVPVARSRRGHPA